MQLLMHGHVLNLRGFSLFFSPEYKSGFILDKTTNKKRVGYPSERSDGPVLVGHILSLLLSVQDGEREHKAIKTQN